MPILNTGQICSRATELCLGRGDFSLSDATFWLNTAYSEMVSVVGHTPLEALAISSTTSGGQRYAIPSDFGSAIALTLLQGSTSTNTNSHTTTVIPLNQHDPRWLDAQTLTNAVTPGVPSDYIAYSSWLEVYPSPNSAYSMMLRYNAKPGTLVNSTDTPLLDERWHAGLIYRTAALLCASRADWEGESMAQNRYLSFMATQPTDKALKQKDRTGMGLRYVRDNS